MRLRLAALLACAMVSGGAPLAQAPRSGIDVSGLDRSILPQDDLYRHVNAWLAAAHRYAGRPGQLYLVLGNLGQGIDRSPAVILAQPSFFKAFAALVPQVPLSTWKAWLLARYLTAAAPYLSKGFDDARFEFFGGVLTGQEMPRVRWKRGVGMVNTFLGDALGRLYVQKHFPQSARGRVQKMLANVLEAYREALGEADWMTPQTRREALEKLSALSTGVGHPARWRNYSALVIKPDDLLGNWQRALKFESEYRLGNVGGTAGGEWLFPPQTINAYYSPGSNEMVLPAAIFQPPVFDFDADDAVNYGAAGSLIGHEIGHAFDERGRQFDGAGEVRDWWTPADAERFAARAGRLAPTRGRSAASARRSSTASPASSASSWDGRRSGARKSATNTCDRCCRPACICPRRSGRTPPPATWMASMPRSASNRNTGYTARRRSASGSGDVARGAGREGREARGVSNHGRR